MRGSFGRVYEPRGCRVATRILLAGGCVLFLAACGGQVGGQADTTDGGWGSDASRPDAWGLVDGPLASPDAADATSEDAGGSPDGPPYTSPDGGAPPDGPNGPQGDGGGADANADVDAAPPPPDAEVPPDATAPSDAEPPNHVPDGGIDGACVPGSTGLAYCPSSPSACRTCLHDNCAMGQAQCDFSQACVNAEDDWLHCRSDGSLLPPNLVLCAAGCADCTSLSICP
jgi:hypothetical protein